MKKKNLKKKPTLQKIKIAKLENLNSIVGGDTTTSNDPPVTYLCTFKEDCYVLITLSTATDPIGGDE